MLGDLVECVIVFRQHTLIHRDTSDQRQYGFSHANFMIIHISSFRDFRDQKLLFKARTKAKRYKEGFRHYKLLNYLINFKKILRTVLRFYTCFFHVLR